MPFAPGPPSQLSDNICQGDGFGFLWDWDPWEPGFFSVTSQAPCGACRFCHWEFSEFLHSRACPEPALCAPPHLQKHLRTEGLAEIEGTEAHGPPGGRNPHTSPRLCHLNIPVQRSQEFMHPFIYSVVHCLGTYCVLGIVLSVLSTLSTLLCSWDYTSTFQMRNSSEESSDLPKVTQPGLEEGWTESSSNSPPGKHQRHGLSSPEALVLGESGPRTLSTQHNSKPRQQ